MGKLEFDEGSHTYWLDGVVLPSVSSIVGKLLKGDPYADVPTFVLERAAKFGTEVHEMIENYNNRGYIEECHDEKKLHCVRQWVRMSKGVEILSSEVRVHYKDIFAGTVDCLARMDGKLVLIDYKTTSKIYGDRLTLQLNLYKIAYEWMYGCEIDILLGAWLPKVGIGGFVDVKLLSPTKLIEAI